MDLNFLMEFTNLQRSALGRRFGRHECRDDDWWVHYEDDNFLTGNNQSIISHALKNP